MTRPEWVEAGARALADATGTGMPWSMETWSDEAAAVIAAVEPLIRADERERNREAEGVELYLATEHAEAVAARLVEVIVEQDFALRTYSYSLTNMTTAWRDAGRVTRAQIAADIEALGHHADCDAYAPLYDGNPSDPRARITGEPCSCGIADAARIARGES